MGSRTYILFAAAGTRFALGVADVRRILPLPRLATPPDCPDALLGFLDIGTELVAVLRFHALFELDNARQPRLYDHLILTRLDRPPVALLVDQVSGVVRRQEGEVKPVADGASLRDCVTGEVADVDGSAHLLSLPCLLGAYEQQRLQHFHEAERRRRQAFGESQ